jgi:hypothetical protein
LVSKEPWFQLLLNRDSECAVNKRRTSSVSRGRRTCRRSVFAFISQEGRFGPFQNRLVCVDRLKSMPALQRIASTLPLREKRHPSGGPILGVERATWIAGAMTDTDHENRQKDSFWHR